MAETRRPHRIQVFSAASDAPRVRRSTDAALAAVGAGLIALLVFVVGGGTAFDDAWAQLVNQLPDWLVWISRASYLVGLAYGLALVVGVGFFAHQRLELLRDLLLAGALAMLGSALLSQLVDDQWPELAITDFDEPTSTFPAFLVTALVAIQAAAAPHLSLPARRTGWGFVIVATAGAVVGGVSEPTDTVGAVVTGLVAAAFIRLAFGTSAGVPSLGRLRSGLQELGLSTTELRYTDEQPFGVTVVAGSATDGTPILARVLGRDAWENRRWSKAWRSAWYQTAGPQLGSTPREQIEHEALVSLLAERAGVSVLETVAGGMSTTGDGIIAVRPLPIRLSNLGADAVDDATLDAIWRATSQLHEADLSHGLLNTSNIWLDGNATPHLGALWEASIQPEPESQLTDIVELLTSLAIVVGTDRALAAARRELGDDQITAALPLLQPAALTPETKRLARHADLKVDELRGEAAHALGTEPPEVEQLQRVSIGRALMVAVTAIAVYVVITGLADIGLQTIIDVLSDAEWGLVLVALIVVQMTNATDAMTVVAASPKPVPVGITTLEQFAIGFINLAVPSTAGRIAVNARFFQRFGINAVTSSATAAITGLVGFVAQIILLVLALVVGKASVDLSGLESDGGLVRVIVFAAVIFIVGLIAVLVIPKWRHWFGQKIRKPLSQVSDAVAVIRHPKNAVMVLGGAIGTELLYASGLTLCVFAVGGSVSLGEAVAINVIVSLFAGLMPIPGGIGVSEAGLYAGLTSVGVESDAAIAAVLIYRLCSYYLPPIWGWVSLRWLTNHDYL